MSSFSESPGTLARTKQRGVPATSGISHEWKAIMVLGTAELRKTRMPGEFNPLAA
ncbi:MAG: hypothetical protein F6K36_30190 [Symploca sp. SIO3C6]|nr:hypothetical protein [Symploca sp. SIO3C6]